LTQIWKIDADQNCAATLRNRREDCQARPAQRNSCFYDPTRLGCLHERIEQVELSASSHCLGGASGGGAGLQENVGMLVLKGTKQSGWKPKFLKGTDRRHTIPFAISAGKLAFNVSDWFGTKFSPQSSPQLGPIPHLVKAPPIVSDLSGHYPKAICDWVKRKTGHLYPFSFRANDRWGARMLLPAHSRLVGVISLAAGVGGLHPHQLIINYYPAPFAATRQRGTKFGNTPRSK
jgi:hypothetical protein